MDSETSISTGNAPIPGIPHNPVISLSGGPTPENCDGDYWYGLITTDEATQVVDLTPRYLEARRARGGGPKFVRVSGPCLRQVKPCQVDPEKTFRRGFGPPRPNAVAVSTAAGAVGQIAKIKICRTNG